MAEVRRTPVFAEFRGVRRWRACPAPRPSGRGVPQIDARVFTSGVEDLGRGIGQAGAAATGYAAEVNANAQKEAKLAEKEQRESERYEAATAFDTWKSQ